MIQVERRRLPRDCRARSYACHARRRWSSSTPRLASPVRWSLWAFCSRIDRVCHARSAERTRASSSVADEGLAESSRAPPDRARRDSFLGCRNVTIENHGEESHRVVLSHTADEGQTVVGGQTYLRQDQIGLEHRTSMKRRRSDPGRVNFHLSVGQDVASRARSSTRARQPARGEGNQTTQNGVGATSGCLFDNGTKGDTSDYTEETVDCRASSRNATSCCSPAQVSFLGNTFAEIIGAIGVT